MNGEFLRGEVYWIHMGDTLGSEEGAGRPGLIISGSKANINCPTLIVAFMSTQSNALSIYPSVVVGGRKQRVLCNQLRTVDKSRVGDCLGTITESEMIRVEGALAIAMCLPNPATMNQPTTKEKDETESLKVEIDVWKRMYETTLSQLVEMRVAADIARKTAIAVEPPRVEERNESADVDGCDVVPTENKTIWDGRKVNINTVATGMEIKRRTGMSMRTANEIIKTRKVVGKYEKLEDLLALDHFGELSMRRYGYMLTVGESDSAVEGEIEKKNIEIEIEPVIPETLAIEIAKTSLNTASTRELMAVGFSKEVSARILHRRRTCGPYKKIEELLTVDGVTARDIRKLGDKLEV